MARTQFVVAQGELDDVAPEQLYDLLSRYQKKYKLRTRYSALTEILQNANSMDRTPMERRMGAGYLGDTNIKQSDTSQRRRKPKKSAVTTPKTQDD